MVTPRQKRQAVGVVMEHSFSERRACKLIGINRNTQRYETRLNKENEKIEKFLRLKVSQPRYQSYGLPRLFQMVVKQFGKVNHKRVETIYRKAGLQLSRRIRKHTKRTPVPLEKPLLPNQCWAMDFMSDSLESNRKFRIFNLIDVYSKESILQVVDFSLQGNRLARELSQLAEQRQLPSSIICDNGPEFTGKAMFRWSEQTGVSLHFIAKGRPTQNGFIESFNGKMRKECLDRHVFQNLIEAREKIMDWVKHYNEERPHSALNYLSPYEFIKDWNVKNKCNFQTGL
ncbi:MAG: IS3 family transposase [Candidatus Cloacimonadaceae bacterium]